MYTHITEVAPVGDVKGVLTDVDFTLVVPDGYDISITPATIQAVEAAQDKDVAILPITSRSLPLMGEALGRLGIKRGFASLDNGGSLFNIATNQYEEQHWLPKAVLRDVLGAIGCHLYGLSCRSDAYVWEGPADIDPDSLTNTPSLFAEFEATNSAGDHIRHFLEPMRVDGVLNYHIMASGKHGVDCLQVCAGGVSKKLGAQQLLHYAGIRPQEAIAIGDGRNDMPLMEAVRPDGLAIAMGNADEELKHFAGVVTDDVWHDGFAHAIDRFVLRK